MHILHFVTFVTNSTGLSSYFGSKPVEFRVKSGCFSFCKLFVFTFCCGCCAQKLLWLIYGANGNNIRKNT